ncbi:glycoside hydrolase family 43 protein [Spirosoma endbachense]|uniref:Family 43 glycosylhydrolase n=1 Tax=Spirosoma endbachense TaxID=2666025 RepID=A0A6P1VKJ8_9BACT|nr:glycoside hydrolase family 43 protein [Spirosoma endbachense]QHV93791.1 family 43 glycosylhydrolase [Spirosoma endbachense]
MKYTAFFSLLIVLSSATIACKKIPSTSSGVTPTQTATQDTSTRFQNPLLTSGPDPWVIYQDGYYYVMHTTGGDLRLYKTKKMSLLGQSQTSVVWSPPATGPVTRDIWAPELHRVNNRWYIYYAAVVAPSTTHRMWVLENEATDPMTGTWILKGQVQLPDNRWAIDGTLLQLNGKLYYAWSGWENEIRNNIQHIYLCTMKNPWTADSPRLRVSTPEYDWEKQGMPSVNEGPEFLTHDNKVFLVYSASHCSTDSYALGMLAADASADLMNLASWQKSDQPVFGPNAADGAYGVGHNSFFITPDNQENWILYHANPQPGQGCSNNRSPRMQRFTWRTNGYPDFGKPVPLTTSLKRPSGE